MIVVASALPLPGTGCTYVNSVILTTVFVSPLYTWGTCGPVRCNALAKATRSSRGKLGLEPTHLALDLRLLSTKLHYVRFGT